MLNKKSLTCELLLKSTGDFVGIESIFETPSLFGVTDGKAVGTFIEHQFQKYLNERFEYNAGNSAKGIDFPELNIDIKVTSIKQPQSSCPYKSARQKIFGLGYSLLIFVYQKRDNLKARTGRLDIQHSVFVSEERTADFQTTTSINNIIENNGNIDDLLALFEERMLPVDSIEAQIIAKEILNKPPTIGYLTISNALQWRLQYSRVIEKASKVEGITKIL